MRHTKYNFQRMLQGLFLELIEELDKRGGEIVVYDKDDEDMESNCEIYIGDGLRKEVVVNRIYRKDDIESPFDIFLDCTIWSSGEALEISLADAQIDICNLDWLLDSIPEE